MTDVLDKYSSVLICVLVLDFESRDQLDAYLAGEPYIIEKVWEDVKVEPLNVVIVKGEKVGK